MHSQATSILSVALCWTFLTASCLKAAETAKETQPLAQSEGEDLGSAGSRRGGLIAVTEPMAAAQSALAARDTSGIASTAQRQALEELDAMIAALEKQCEKCGGQCNQPSSPSNKPQKPSGKAGMKPGATAATAATAATRIDGSAMSNLVKDLWGRLPDRQREELLQPLSEEFLPEYADDIEEYFRVLAETPPTEEAVETQP